FVPVPLPPGVLRGPDQPTETGVTAAPTLQTNARARRGTRMGLFAAAGALAASCIVLVFALALRTGRSDSAVAGATAAAAEPVAAAPPSATPDPPPVDSSGWQPVPVPQPIDLPPVELSAPVSALPVAIDDYDAGLPVRRPSRVKPGKRTSYPPAPPRPKPTEPQIVTEPRY
ncbi:MAG TPA: hypothetical protein VMI75_18140, partial [Polyangiaceae bacterium]|nr:hypothetical protein [Polyangiaceae bacterium]